jgi:uncharacterized membrane protein
MIAVVSGIIMLMLDSLYLTGVSPYFNDIVNGIQGSRIQFNFVGAILCYLLLISGLNYFIISRGGSLWDAFILGIVIYGVFETTNYTIFSGWPLGAVVLDTLWGGILFSLTTYLTLLIK